jgi:hypothetical protein
VLFSSEGLPERPRSTFLIMQRPQQTFRLALAICFSLIPPSLAQDPATETQTLWSQDIYSSQKPCAQQCFLGDFGGCGIDQIAVPNRLQLQRMQRQVRRNERLLLPNRSPIRRSELCLAVREDEVYNWGQRDRYFERG